MLSRSFVSWAFGAACLASFSGCSGDMPSEEVGAGASGGSGATSSGGGATPTTGGAESGGSGGTSAGSAGTAAGGASGTAGSAGTAGAAGTAGGGTGPATCAEAVAAYTLSATPLDPSLVPLS